MVLEERQVDKSANHLYGDLLIVRPRENYGDPGKSEIFWGRGGTDRQDSEDSLSLFRVHEAAFSLNKCIRSNSYLKAYLKKRVKRFHAFRGGADRPDGKGGLSGFSAPRSCSDEGMG